MKPFPFILLTSLLHFLVLELSTAVDTISPLQSITGTNNLVSSCASFEFGLSSAGSFRYLGTWYKNFPDIVVWVADRENPPADSNRSLTISENGSLLLLDQMNNTIWSSSSSQVAEDPEGQHTGYLRNLKPCVLKQETVATKPCSIIGRQPNNNSLLRFRAFLECIMQQINNS
ncbi:unnamed protein product [Malus baccata var. baccata]